MAVITCQDDNKRGTDLRVNISQSHHKLQRQFREYRTVYNTTGLKSKLCAVFGVCSWLTCGLDEAKLTVTRCRDFLYGVLCLISLQPDCLSASTDHMVLVLHVGSEFHKAYQHLRLPF